MDIRRRNGQPHWSGVESDFQDRGGNDDTGDIITYFTPIQDVFDDILQATGATEISILSNGKLDEEEKGKEMKKASEHLNSNVQT
jgi:hypothetical protein